MDKLKMLQSLNLQDHEKIMERMIWESVSWDNIRQRIAEGYALSPFVLQSVVERGWADPLKEYLQTENFYSASVQDKNMVMWLEGFFGKQEFTNICLRREWNGFLACQELPAEVLVEHQKWEILKEHKEYQILIDNGKLDMLPECDWKQWIPLLLKRGKGEFVFSIHKEHLLLEFSNLKKEIADLLIKGKHWQILTQLGLPEQKLYNILLEAKEFDWLIKLKAFGFLYFNGRRDVLAKAKIWWFLLEMKDYDLIDWEDYYQMNKYDSDSLKVMLWRAVKAGAVDFLSAHGKWFKAFMAKFQRYKMRKQKSRAKKAGD